MENDEILKKEKVHKIQEFYVFLTLNHESETFRVYYGFHNKEQTNFMLGPYQNKIHSQIAFEKTVAYFLDLYDAIENPNLL